MPKCTIAEIMMMVAAIAASLCWPQLLVITTGAILGVALDRVGLTLTTIRIIFSILGFSYG